GDGLRVAEAAADEDGALGAGAVGAGPAQRFDGGRRAVGRGEGEPQGQAEQGDEEERHCRFAEHVANLWLRDRGGFPGPGRGKMRSGADGAVQVRAYYCAKGWK